MFIIIGVVLAFGFGVIGYYYVVNVAKIQEAGFSEFLSKRKNYFNLNSLQTLFKLDEGKIIKFRNFLGDESKDENNDESKDDKAKQTKAKPKAKQKVSLVFVGETGVGKSTLLKSIEDFINGVSYEEVKCTPKGVNGGAESVTQETNQYVLSNDEWAVNIIDTPGIGDTRGVSQDEKNMGNITEFLGDYGEFNAVCILIKRGSSRLTERFRYIVNEIRANLPKDVSENFLTIMTRADVAIPDEDTRKAIEELRLPTDNIVPINNLAYEEMDLSSSVFVFIFRRMICFF